MIYKYHLRWTSRQVKKWNYREGGGADPGIYVGGALLQRTLHLENIFQSALHLGPSQRALKKDLQNKNNNIEPRSVRNVHNLVER